MLRHYFTRPLSMWSVRYNPTALLLLVRSHRVTGMPDQSVFREKVGALAAAQAGRADPVVEAFRFAEDEMVWRTSR